MKKKLILLTALVLLISMFTTPAGAVSNIRCEQDRSGHVVVSWSDFGSGPYEVQWSLGSWDGWCVYDEFDSSPGVVGGMVPGATYNVTVKSGSDSDSTTYTVPKGTFTDFKSGKKVTCSIDSFDARSESIYQTIQVRLYFPRLSKERRYTWQLALWTPKGYVGLVKYNDNFRMEPKYSYYYWDLDFSEWMNSVEKYFGKIMSGDYVFEMYLNGQYYGGVGFYVYN